MKVKSNNSPKGLIKPNTEYEVIGSINEWGYFEFKIPEDPDCIHCGVLKNDGHLGGGNWIIVGETPNRDYLRDFVKMNNIKTMLVSKALGKSENWLTQMMNDKRRDMTDATLQSILKKLHIDWASSEWLHVKDEVPYRTKPCNYTTVQHKERLQKAFWRGLVK